MVEDGLGVERRRSGPFKGQRVLILVVVEDGLGECVAKLKDGEVDES